MKNYLELAKIRRKTKNIISEDQIQNIPINEFVCLLYVECDPASYGRQMEIKLVHDTESLIQNIKANEDTGEFLIGGKKVEMKTSYLGKNGTYRLANMRDWQDVDYFVLFLVDCDDEFKLRVYMVDVNFIYNNCNIHAMDNVKKINEANVNYNKGTNFRPDFIEKLDKVNILRGNTYQDLKDYIYYMNGKSINQTENKKIIVTRKANTKISFKVGDNWIINGRTNAETVTKLSQILGHENIVGKFWDSQISNQQTPVFSVPIGGGYFFNPKFSLRDIKKNIRTYNRKSQNKIEIIEEPKNKWMKSF